MIGFHIKGLEKFLERRVITRHSLNEAWDRASGSNRVVISGLGGMGP